jgi:hypothetical protein
VVADRTAGAAASLVVLPAVADPAAGAAAFPAVPPAVADRAAAVVASLALGAVATTRDRDLAVEVIRANCW